MQRTTAGKGQSVMVRSCGGPWTFQPCCGFFYCFLLVAFFTSFSPQQTTKRVKTGPSRQFSTRPSPKPTCRPKRQEAKKRLPTSEGRNEEANWQDFQTIKHLIQTAGLVEKSITEDFLFGLSIHRFLHLASSFFFSFFGQPRSVDRDSCKAS